MVPSSVILETFSSSSSSLIRTHPGRFNPLPLNESWKTPRIIHLIATSLDNNTQYTTKITLLPSPPSYSVNGIDTWESVFPERLPLCHLHLHRYACWHKKSSSPVLLASMGNSNGKPVVFTDEGMYHTANGDVCQHYRAANCFTLAQSEVLSDLSPNNSQPKSFPPATSSWKGGIWEGSNRGKEGYRIDFRLEVHPQR